MAHIKEAKRNRRKLHIRKKLSGTAEKPRVFVYRSNKYIQVGVANDTDGKVLLSRRGPKNIESAKKLGDEIGKELKKAKVEKAVFDRSGYKYHGKVKAIAEGIREAGIQM